MTAPEQLHWLPEHPDLDGALRSLKRQGGTPEQRLRTIAALAGHRLDALATARLDRALGAALSDAGEDPIVPAAAGLDPLRLAWLCTSTIDHLVPATRVAGLRRRLLVQAFVPPYGQVAQQVLDEESALHAFAPQAALFALDPAGALAALPLEASAADVEAAIAARVADLRRLWQRVRDRHRCLVIQETVPNVAVPLFGSYEHAVPAAPSSMLAALNRQLAVAAREERVALLDLDGVAADGGRREWFDAALWHHGKQLVSPRLAPRYGDLVARILGAARGRSGKVLVLDLDNTLWGGVIGDDGVEGIVLGQGSAAGEAFAAFQSYARRLGERGIVLAVCSKNTEEVARDAFERHPEMVLRLGDIACFLANWDDKAQNLRRIADTLQLGLDALVFVDDNPVERALVRRELPMVMVPEVGDEPAGYARLLADGGYFEALAFTADDRARARQYQDNAARARLESSATDVDSFLRSLEMVLEHGPFDAANLPRITQLANKTNQWNLTTRRYTEAEVAALAGDPGAVTLWLRLVDRFGDNGLIGVLVARPDGDEARAAGRFTIESWLMSCRVLGRQVEQGALALLVERARSLGARELIGNFLPTAKNKLVKDHYARMGFELVAEGRAGPGSTRWRLALAGFAPPPTHLTFKPQRGA